MDQFFRFHDLAVGHRVKVKGKLAEDGAFAALQISLRPPDHHASIEGVIQEIDHQNFLLRVLNREIGVPANALIKDAEHQHREFKNLRVEDVVKIKGVYNNNEGLVPIKIKVQETMGFHIDELQGAIDHIDHESRALQLAGFTVAVTERTTIEGF